MHVEDENSSYIEFDPSTARATAVLAGSAGASAAGVNLSDSSPTLIRKWPVTMTACGAVGRCPTVGQPCSPTDMAINAVTTKSIIGGPSSFRCC